MGYVLNDQQIDNLRIIIEKIAFDDKDWLEEKDINPARKGGYRVCDYGKESVNEFNSLCRGLILKDQKQFTDPLELIRSFPFIRFFNHAEPFAHPINFENSTLIEKLDGGLFSIFFENDEQIYHTRKMLSITDFDHALESFMDGHSYKILRIFEGYIQQLNFNEEDKNFTYMFELIHKSTGVLTLYHPEEFGVYLVGGRNLRTFKELTELELDEVAKRIGSFRPLKWDSHGDLDYVFQFLKEASKQRELFEGFIVRDNETGERVKVKTQNYVDLHHHIDGSTRSIAQRIFSGEINECLAYFPVIKHKVERIQIRHDKIVAQTVQTVEKFYQTEFNSKFDMYETLQKTNFSALEKEIAISNFGKSLNGEKLQKLVEEHLKNLAIHKTRKYLKFLDL